jgi:hypothetical protein
VPAIPARPGLAERYTRPTHADQRCQLADGFIDHLVSPVSFGALPVASCSNNAESFPWTSITLRAVSNSPSSRSTRRCNLAFSRSRGSAPWRPAGSASASSAPRSRYLRHSEISDEYSPSRRSNAPLPAWSSVSYSARTRALYLAE